MADARQNLILNIKAYDMATPQLKALELVMRKNTAAIIWNTRAKKEASVASNTLAVSTTKATYAQRGFGRALWYSSSGLRGLAGGLGIINPLMGGLAVGALGLGAVFAGATKAFAKFEFKMLYVKSLARLSTEEYNKLSASVLKLAGDSVHTTKQLADLQVELAKAGLNADQIKLTTKPIADFGLANFIGGTEASRIAINTANQFGISLNNINKVTGVLTSSVNQSTITITEFTEAMKYLGPRSDVIGGSLEELSAIVAHLGNQGFRGGRATRALGSALVRLGRHAKEFEAFNVNLFDEKGQRKGVFSFLTQLGDSLKLLGDKTGHDLQNNMRLVGRIIYEKGGGVEALAQMLSIYKSVIGDKKVLDIYESLKKANIQTGTNVLKLADVLNNSTWGNILKMNSAFNKLAVAMGESFAPMAIGLTKAMTRMMNGLSWIFGDKANTINQYRFKKNGEWAYTDTPSINTLVNPNYSRKDSDMARLRHDQSTRSLPLELMQAILGIKEVIKRQPVQITIDKVVVDDKMTVKEFIQILSTQGG